MPGARERASDAIVVCDPIIFYPLPHFWRPHQHYRVVAVQGHHDENGEISHQVDLSQKLVAIGLSIMNVTLQKSAVGRLHGHRIYGQTSYVISSHQGFSQNNLFH